MADQERIGAAKESSGSNLGDATDALRMCQGNALNVILELDIQDLRNAPSIYALRAAIEWNTTLKTAHFTLDGRLEEFTQSDRLVLGSLIEAVAGLPDLTTFVLASQYMPMPEVTTVLRHARGLHKLELRHFKNLPSFEHNKRTAFCGALGDHPSLQSFTFHPLIHRYVPEEHLFMSLLFETLSGIPTLQEVDITSNACNSSNLSGRELVHLCSSAGLTRLKLDAQNEIGADGVVAAANNANIRELLLSCASTRTCTAALTDLIKENRGITKLTLIYHEGLTSEGHIIEVARALRTNSTLLEVSIQPGDLSIPTLEVFVETARLNYTLRYFNVFDDETMIKRTSLEEIEHTKDKEEKAALILGKKIEFYSLLNRSGRGFLLGDKTSATKNDWLDKLGAVSHNLDCLFFFLRVNPALCCGSWVDSPVGPSQKKRARLG